MPILMGSDDIGLGVGGSAGGDNIDRGAEHKIKQGQEFYRRTYLRQFSCLMFERHS